MGADLYAASGASLATQVDPLTGNRYLYAGANPAGLIDNGYNGLSDFLTGNGGCIFGYTNGPGSACRASREVKDTINAVTQTSPSQLVSQVGDGAKSSFVEAPLAKAKQVTQAVKRGPDYFIVSANLPSGVSASLILDRNGNVYVGLGYGKGTSDVVPSISGAIGYLNQTNTPTPDQLKQFLEGATGVPWQASFRPNTTQADCNFDGTPIANGNPAIAGSVTHCWTQNNSAGVTVSLTFTFAVSYRVNGGAPIALAPITRTATLAYPVQNIDSVITARG